MSQVIIFPRGQLTPVDRERMEAAGIVAVEADDPSAVVTVIPGAPLLGPDDLTMAAISAVASSGHYATGDSFAKTLRQRLAAKEKK